MYGHGDRRYRSLAVHTLFDRSGGYSATVKVVGGLHVHFLSPYPTFGSIFLTGQSAEVVSWAKCCMGAEPVERTLRRQMVSASAVLEVGAVAGPLRRACFSSGAAQMVYLIRNAQLSGWKSDVQWQGG